jgi:hypothetical protein
MKGGLVCAKSNNNNGKGRLVRLSYSSVSLTQMHTQNGARPREGINALHYYWTNPLHHLQSRYSIAVSLDLYAASFVEEYVKCAMRGRDEECLLYYCRDTQREEIAWETKA